MLKKSKPGQLSALNVGVVVFFVTALITVAIMISKQHTANQNSLAPGEVQFTDEYPLTPDDNSFIYASEAEVIEILNEGTGLVFLGFKECPWCQQLAPLINEAARAEGLAKIYYLDIRQSRDSSSKTYQQLVQRLEPYLEKDEAGKPRIFVPDVSAVNRGEITGRFEQESAPASQSTPDTFWTPERKERAVKQLREIIRPLVY